MSKGGEESSHAYVSWDKSPYLGVPPSRANSKRLTRALFIQRGLVLANNQKAIRLHGGLGFETRRVLPGALKEAGRHFDVELMCLTL